MPHQIVTIPCLSDNYAFLIHDDTSGATALVDAPEPGPILDELKTRGWTLSHVLLTHHHWDHIDGLPDILAAHPAKIIGAKADEHRLPPLDLAVTEGDTFEFAGESVSILDVSGHTVGHIAFHFPDTAAVFTGDSLMAMGCGRLFEGTPAQMFASLSKLAALPDATTVCSGHEYTAANCAFAVSLGEDNATVAQRIADTADKRAKGIATVPSNLGLEKQTNPFLRSASLALQKALSMEGAAPVDVFTEVRKRKDTF
ncbi:hydroxyacylglutathione hydrolase [uncultured Shimia sp.]|uniref:hydroxyacylglutathione hydrolase n=1 Tax=uncultured Shimia sp. TaxID=573152 RepID=UPI00262186F6|nr:hydroxyacylglutathione hydrolase [uncultured Shimia sp.]